ncbi:MAG: hypothetical protein ABEN55_19455 [Bradymonadaceae bacterium]
MIDELTDDARHRCQASYRPLAEVTDALARLDAQLTRVEQAIANSTGADDRWRLPIAEDRTVLVEGGVPYTTVYVTTDPAARTAGSSILRPAIHLSRFWRLWRPPPALLGPAEREWLASRDLNEDPAPPLPARYDRRDGWRDFPAEQIAKLIGLVVRAADALSDGESEPQKGAA